MQAVVPGDAAGTSKRHRTFRLVGSVNGQLIPICRTIFGKDGSVYFVLMMGDSPFAKIGEASLKDGKISFDSESSLEDVPVGERKKTHVSLHPEGRCHIRERVSPPVSHHNLCGWFPVRREFDWIHAYSAPIGTLPKIDKLHVRDAVMLFSSTQVSARLHVSICPRTSDGSVPLLNDKIYTFAGISPNYIIRISVDEHPATAPTVVIRKSLGEGAKKVGSA